MTMEVIKGWVLTNRNAWKAFWRRSVRFSTRKWALRWMMEASCIFIGGWSTLVTCVQSCSVAWMGHGLELSLYPLPIR